MDGTFADCVPPEGGLIDAPGSLVGCVGLVDGYVGVSGGSVIGGAVGWPRPGVTSGLPVGCAPG